MATFQLPTPATPTSPMPFGWETRYVLEGRNYWFNFRYNDRQGFWYLSVAGVGRITQVQGVALTLGTDKLGQFKYNDIPPGSFDVVDTNGTFLEPTIADFGLRVILQYTDFVDTTPDTREKFPVTLGPS